MKAFEAVARLIRLCCVCLLLLGLSTDVGHAEENGDGNKSVAEEFHQPSAGTKQPAPVSSENTQAVTAAPSGWTFLIQVIFSLGLIIFLIYLLLRFLASKQSGLTGKGGGMKVVSAVGVGNGKTVQVVLIGDSLYVLGVGENVTLLRHIPAGDEMDTILADMVIKPTIGKWDGLISRWQSRKQEETLSVSEELHPPRSFDEMLEQKWDEVAGETKMGLWDEEDRHGKGDRI